MTPATLIDEWMPLYDAVERHSRLVAAPAATVYAALWRTDFAASGVVRWLLALRGLRVPRRLTLTSLAKGGFVQLGDRPPHEVAFGIAGKFWTPSGGRTRLDAEAFRSFARPGCAKAVWNFTVDDAGGGSTRVATETRIRCLDDAARRRFRLYWAVVSRFSGLIRISMLRAIAQEASR